MFIRIFSTLPYLNEWFVWIHLGGKPTEDMRALGLLQLDLSRLWIKRVILTWLPRGKAETFRRFVLGGVNIFKTRRFATSMHEAGLERQGFFFFFFLTGRSLIIRYHDIIGYHRIIVKCGSYLEGVSVFIGHLTYNPLKAEACWTTD